MRRNTAHLLILAGSSLWCGALIAAPVLKEPRIYDFFSAICHQNPTRSWFLFGSPMPVCIRCTSIYFGFFIAASVCTKERAGWLRVALLATMVEFVIARIWLDSPVLRAMTGLALGATAAPFVRLGMVQMLETIGTAWKRNPLHG